jgi:hypothetical protein
MVDLLLVRRLEPWRANVGKRLSNPPESTCGIPGLFTPFPDSQRLMKSSVTRSQASWEGFVIETLCSCMPAGARTNFYRTSAGVEIDLVLFLPGDCKWAIEIKRSLSPKIERGFHHACVDISADRKFVVYPGVETYPLGNDIVATPPQKLAGDLARR